MCRKLRVFLAAFIAVMAVCPCACADLIGGDVLDGATVRFHPLGSISELSIRDDGSTGGHSVIHMYRLGTTSRFYLEKADSDSYYIYMFNGAAFRAHKTHAYCMLDVEYNGIFDHGHSNEGNVIHIVGKGTDDTKRWKFIQQPNGTYYIQNKSTGKYWTVDDNKNGSKLKQSSTPHEWEVEVVDPSSSSNYTYNKNYSSFRFFYNGNTVNSLNWMSNLPDDTRITDVSIPGVHDAATCHVEKWGDFSICQQLYIDNLLYSGVRYLDLRMAKDGDSLILRHGSDYCHAPDGSVLKIDAVMEWIEDFFSHCPSETVIIQIKSEVADSDTKDIYNYFKNIVNSGRNLIYVGGPSPKMSQLRGKILIISRLDLEYAGEGANYDVTNSNGEVIGQWAIQASSWQQGNESSYAKAATLANGECEVWTQDHYNMTADVKWDWIEGSIPSAYSKSQSAKSEGKNNWYIGYTSCTNLKWHNLSHTPLHEARSVNPRLKSASWMNDNRFLGVVCTDFIDEKLANLIYSHNFEGSTLTAAVHSSTSDKLLVNPVERHLTYNAASRALIIPGYAKGATISYALGSDDATPPTEWSTEIPRAAEKGTYYVWYTVNDTEADDGIEHDAAPKCVVSTIGNISHPLAYYDIIVSKDAVSDGRISLSLVANHPEIITESHDNPASYTIDSNDIALKTPDKDGYTFMGWVGADTGNGIGIDIQEGIDPDTTVALVKEVIIPKGSSTGGFFRAVWVADESQEGISSSSGGCNSGIALAAILLAFMKKRL